MIQAQVDAQNRMDAVLTKNQRERSHGFGHARTFTFDRGWSEIAQTEPPH